MNKQQILIITGAAALTLGLYFLVPVVNPEKGVVTAAAPEATAQFDIEKYRESMVVSLPEPSQQYLSALEAQVKRGDVKQQNHTLNHQLSTFWRDSVPNPILHFYYSAQVAELDNTEKSLTFAAHSILGYLPFLKIHEEKHWLAGRGKDLFEQALVLNPSNDSSHIGLGGCIMYGAPAAEGENSMAGIMKVREVAERDSTNMFAQYMLGIGGMISGQFDKAAVRFEKVALSQPENLEARFKVAEAYELMGNKNLAADWYEQVALKVTNAEMKTEILKRVAELRN